MVFGINIALIPTNLVISTRSATLSTRSSDNVWMTIEESKPIQTTKAVATTASFTNSTPTQVNSTTSSGEKLESSIIMAVLSFALLEIGRAFML
jgi:hypothetical protein